MITIKLYAHPFIDQPPQIFERENIGEWLLEHYGQRTEIHVDVYEGEPSLETKITGNIDALVLSDCPEYTVLETPKGLTLFEWFAVISFVLSVAAVALAPKPGALENVNRTQSSPNNELGARNNKVRLLERIEDIFGKVHSVPSLIAPTYVYYSGGNKLERGVYCIGKGYYDSATLQATLNDGGTLLANIPGSKISAFAPFKLPNGTSANEMFNIGGSITDVIETHKQNKNVDGIVLKAPNQVNTIAADNYAFKGNYIIQENRHPGFASVFNPGDTVHVTMSPYHLPWFGGGMAIDSDPATHKMYDDTGAGFFADLIAGDIFVLSGGTYVNGTYTFVSYGFDSGLSKYYVIVSETVAATPSSDFVTIDMYIDYSGDYTVSAVSDVNNGVSGVTDNYSTLTLTTSFYRTLGSAPTAASWINCTAKNPNASEWSQWIVIDNAEQKKLLFNAAAINGIYKDAGQGYLPSTVDIEYEVQQLVAGTPTGSIFTISSTLNSNNANEPTGSSEVYNLLTSAGFSGALQCRARRSSNYNYSFTGSIIDEVRWESIWSIIPITQANFGNITFLATEFQLNQKATTSTSRELSCDAARLIPTYNGSTWSAVLNPDGSIASGTLHTSSKLIDIIAAVSLDPLIGQRTLADDLDIAQIWSVQQALDVWDGTSGQFNYTFDSDNISYEETITTIANAGFCVAYRQNGKIRLAFDHQQTSSTALFTHRNKKPNSDTITRTFASDSDYDGVEFTYNDNVSNQQETFTLPLDGSATKVKKVEIPGVRNYNQAWYRANRELARLRGQRITIETYTTMDARALLPNARVDIVDNTRYQSYDGEIVGQSGLTLTLSNEVQFGAGSNSIILMKRDGSLQSLGVTLGSATNKVVLSGLPAEAIVTTPGVDGIRTIYSFGPDSAHGAQAYLVQEIDLADGQYAKIRAINYSDSYYTADTLPIPLRASVIN